MNSLFERKDDQVQLYDVRLRALSTPDTTSLRIRSESFNASIDGNFRLSTLPAALEKMADFYVNLMPGKDPETDTINHFTYQADLLQVNPILDFFFPKLQIADGSQISGSYVPLKELYRATGTFPKLEIGPVSWSGATFQARTLNNEFNFDFRSDSMVYGENYALRNQQIQLFTLDDIANLHLTWDNQSEKRYSGEINLSGAFRSDTMSERSFVVDVRPSQLYINDAAWNVDQSTVLLRKQYLNVDNLSLSSLDKYLLADGTIASGENAGV